MDTLYQCERDDSGMIEMHSKIMHPAGGSPSRILEGGAGKQWLQRSQAVSTKFPFL